MTHKLARIFSAVLLGVLATGELLYLTHCIGCHSAQMHWRDNRIAKDWPGLKFQVKRWQNEAGLLWSEQEVADVAHYLNVVHYQFPTPSLATLRRSATR
jgi:mono/diheme cytochrome c family protein